MGAYILSRLLRAVPLFLGLSLIVFALIHAAPGGPLTVYLSNPNVTPEDIARLERNLGLDRPLPVQYVSWLTAFMKGDWGYSYVDGRPVLERILERAPATLELMASAFVLALFVALLLGSLAALRPGSLVDRLVSSASIVGISIPTFWLGLILQLVFERDTRQELRARGTGARPSRIGCFDWTRASERALSAHHGSRARLRFAVQRRCRDRDGFCVARHGDASSRLRLPARLLGADGDLDGGIGAHRHLEPSCRHRLRRGRPTRAFGGGADPIKR